MNVTVRAIIGICLALVMYFTGSLIQSAGVFGFSPIVVEVLKISSGAFALLANLIPSVFASENYKPQP